MLIYGDCLEEMAKLPDKSVDMCLTDPPYGTTACKWDTVIAFEPMWQQLKRIVKDNGAICLLGSEPFSSHLRISNLKMFKYDWLWKKHKASNFMLVKKQPRRLTEVISIFYFKQCKYYPQMKELSEQGKKRNNRTQNGKFKVSSGVFGDMTKLKEVTSQKNITMGYPSNIIAFNEVVNSSSRVSVEITIISSIQTLGIAI